VIRGRKRAKIVVPDNVVNTEYFYQKERHPSGRCIMGDWGWIWIERSLSVRCKLCGYRMKINPRTRKLEHLDPLKALKAVENCGAIRTYSGSENL